VCVFLCVCVCVCGGAGSEKSREGGLGANSTQWRVLLNGVGCPCRWVLPESVRTDYTILSVYEDPLPL
jgi:hypothetical protein